MCGKRLEGLLNRYRKRYQGCDRGERSAVLDEFCSLTGYHRKYAISLLGAVAEEQCPPRRRGSSYSAKALEVIEAIWEAADYPWSERLVGMLPAWLPWARQRISGVTDEVAAEVLSISARQVDRRLRDKKVQLKRRIYGGTKPGTLLKHQIPIRTEHWDVKEPGHVEIDLVSHSGQSASGEFIYSLNVTDIQTGWCETRAIMGKGEAGVVKALEEIRQSLPFTLKSIDSDNGSEFINHHLVRYCKRHKLQFTRSRPYKKNDNAHIEQKNWTHVRFIFGWDRYDTQEQLQAMNALYRGELRLMLNLFQARVKLVSKERVGSRVRRRHDKARTPLQRLLETNCSAHPGCTKLAEQLGQLNPFELSHRIEQHLNKLEIQRRQQRKPAA